MNYLQTFIKHNKLLGINPKLFYFTVLFCFITFLSWGQIPYTETFTSFTGAGFQSTPIAGQLSSNSWAITGFSDGALAFGGTRMTTNTDFTRGSSSVAVNTGGIYSFDLGGSNGNALGVQPGGSDFNTNGTFTLRVQNTTGSAITSLNVAYELWVRNDQARSSSFNFSYSQDNITYTSISGLDYTSTAALDALGWQKNNRTTNLTGLNIPTNGYIYLRWTGTDVGGSGNRDEFALDNISVIVPQAEIYVKATGGNDTNTGANFSTAFATLQKGLSVAGAGSKIYIAAGTYKPSVGVDINGASGIEAREVTFQIPNGVEVYGGFAGTETGAITQAVLDARVFTTNTTILSGDINGDDNVTGTFPNLVYNNYTENAFHVVYTKNVSSCYKSRWSYYKKRKC